MCKDCNKPITGSYYEHINSLARYHVDCFAKLAAQNLAFKLLCKLKF